MTVEDLQHAYDAAAATHDLPRAVRFSKRLLKQGPSVDALARHARLYMLLGRFAIAEKLIEELEQADALRSLEARAECSLERGLYDRAFTAATELLKQDPRNVAGFAILAHIHRFRRNFDAALANVAAGLAAHPGNARLLAERGAIVGSRENANRDVAAAWTDIDAALTAEPFNETAIAALSQCFESREGDVADRFEKLVQRCAPSDFLVRAHYAMFRLQICADPAAALQLAEDALRHNHSNQWAWLRKMDALERLAQQRAADSALDQARKRVPLSARIQRRALYRKRTTGNIAAASAILDDLEQIEPGSVELIESRLDILRRSGRMVEALALAAEAETATRSANLRRMIAYTYINGRQFENARRVLEAMPAMTQLIWSDRILCDIVEGDYPAGLVTASKAEKAFPNGAGILALKAWLCANRGHFTEAHDLLERAERADRSNVYPSIIRAEVQLMECECAKADDTARETLERTPDRTDLLHVRGEIALRDGDYPRAVAIAKQILTLDGSNTPAMQLEAMALTRQGQRDVAFEWLEEKIRAFPNSPGLRACRGQLRLEDDDVRGATEDFAWAVDASPAALMAKTGLGTIAYRRRRLADARYWFQRAVEVQPASIEALTNCAWSYAVGATPRELNLAEQLCNKARQYGRNHPRALAVAGVIAFKRGERRKALRLMQAASDGAPENIDLRVNLAATQRRTGRLEDAVATLNEALKADRRHTRARVELASVLLKQRKYEDARTMAESAADENPGSGAAWRILAATHVAAGNATEGESVLRRAMVECDAGELPEIRVDLARLLLTTTVASARDARLREAREHLAAVLDESENHPEALLLQAWSELKLERPALALRALDRLPDDRLRGYAVSLRQAAVEQRAMRNTAAGPRLQWVLAGIIGLQVVLLWASRFVDKPFVSEKIFSLLLPAFVALLFATFLLPRLVTVKVATMLEAQLSAPPAAVTVDAIIAPLSEFEMQPSLDPVVGVLAYDS